MHTTTSCQKQKPHIFIGKTLWSTPQHNLPNLVVSNALYICIEQALLKLGFTNYVVMCPNEWSGLSQFENQSRGSAIYLQVLLKEECL